MATCILCNNVADTEVCASCQHLTGVREMAPARRRTAPCVRCNHPKLIRVIPREMSVTPARVEESRMAPLAHYAPMAATYAVKTAVVKGFFDSDEFVAPPTPLDGLGVFEAYICKRCGFVDWYCQDPESIPIGPEFMTEEVDSESTEPYR
jgi:hypothetical protein